MMDKKTIRTAPTIFGDSLPKIEFETVFVNKRGEIAETKRCEVYYYEEILRAQKQSIFSQTRIQSPKSRLIYRSPKTKIPMIYIPEGKFWMGSPKDKKDRYENEIPQHKVTICSFFISETTITEAQWRFVAINLHQEQRELNPNPASNGDDYPVVNVNWQDAIEFCARLSRYTGRNYRLPSEAEWEYACRSVSSEELTQSEWNEKYSKPFHFGETITSKLANYDSLEVYQEKLRSKDRGHTTPVGIFKPNAFGLYDMHGNVCEWCLDPWHDNYQGAPSDGQVWDEGKEELYKDILTNLNTLLQDNKIHVIRGGSWLLLPSNCRSASRIGYFPRIGSSNVGFRVVCSAPL